MSVANAIERRTPSRAEALRFQLKVRTFQARRLLVDMRQPPPRHGPGVSLSDAPLLGEARSALWNDNGPEEFPLTAGKVQNLRRAARALHGLEIPAGEIFSFWRQLGRTTRRRGYVDGRELREGCLVPAIGGGLCQLSGLLYRTALAAGLEILERHGHSRVVPGSTAEHGLDATIFWNYVDLRFRAPIRWRLEVELDASHLTTRIRAAERTGRPNAPEPESAATATVTGDCLTCGQSSCFRHPGAAAAHAPSPGHTTFLLDARWPEFDRWCAGRAGDGDRWLIPLDGARWNRSNYAWHPPASATVGHATLPVLLRSLRQRRLPAQGAVRQAALLAADAALSKYYASRISPGCRHLVVSQNLLPHLRRLGILGGRTYDVLVHRWPLEELHHRLDDAARAHPASPTLADFRADPALLRDEGEALAAAGRLVTPHRALAAHFGSRALRIDWHLPDVPTGTPPADADIPRLFLPCSPLGRKGIHELVAALRDTPAELLVLGRAREDDEILRGIRWRQASLAELMNCHALVLPAWIEHQPRLALRALASAMPVIATDACGLPDHPCHHRIARPDAGLLAAAIRRVLEPLRCHEAAPPTASPDD